MEAEKAGEGPASIWATLPRPTGLGTSYEGGNLPARREIETFRAGFWRTFGRLFVWLHAVFRFFAGILWDKLLRKDSMERRARRLRKIIEGVGTTFIKFGQQLSIRIDVLPYEYALELEKMLDKVKAYPSRHEIEEIFQSTTGRSVQQAFSQFDPKPIGSGSVACVYQARLRSNGERVAVKIRRPGIGKVFAADMRVLRWLLWVAELVLIPPGFARPFHHELNTMLSEELDFEAEARFAEIFRRRVKKARMGFVTAPKVYFELTSKQVLVTEFVTGFWLKEVIQAIESDDTAALTILKENKIKPKKVAQRLLTVARYGALEGLFFHADLHPANVLVRPNSKLTLIDFGSCGSMTERERHLWRHFFHSHANEDVGGMTQAALGLFSSIPPIDIDEFARKVEAVFLQDLYANKSRKSAWWQRTSVNMWVGILRLTQEYRIPMNLNMLRMIRISLLSDTLAARLYHKIDHWKEYQRFAVGAGARAKERLRGKIEWLKSNEAYIRYEELFDSGFTAFFRMQRFLDTTVFNLSKLENTISYAISLFIRVTFGVSLVASLAVIGSTLLGILRGRASGDLLGFINRQLFFDGWLEVLTNKWFGMFVLIVAMVNIRRILIRLAFKDIRQFDRR